jgi:dTDP-glucose 4,6-dehydratase
MERIDESFPFQEASSVVDGYLQGKRAMEALLCACDQGLEMVVARCFAFVGYGLPAHLAIGQFIRDAKQGDGIAINGDGQPVRSFLYAADLSVWLLALLAKGTSRQAYNVGSPEGRTLAETAAIVRDVLAPGKPVIIKGVEGHSARRRYLPDVGKAERELGLCVWTQLPEAVRQTACSLECQLEVASVQGTDISNDA